MGDTEPVWFIANRASRSNDEGAVAEVEAALAKAGFVIAGRTAFPEEALPDHAMLDHAGIRTVCIFAGDGTIHSAVIHLYDWTGRLMILPGGTMNLLSHRLHGEASASEIIARLGGGNARTVRPPMLTCDGRYALTGALAGPGTAWNEVREAVREATITNVLSATAEAAAESIAGERVVCRGLESMRPDGYAAISLKPCKDGVETRGYYAQMPGDYLGQLAAILSGDFRDGPHDLLGTFPSVEVLSLNGGAMGLLMDGEPEKGHSCERFTMARCQVDLMASGESG